MNANYRRQVNNIKRETKNSAILDDVINTGLEATPGNAESVYNQTRSLQGVEESVVRYSTDGKTYNKE